MEQALAVEAVKAVAQLVAARAMEEIRLAWRFKDQLEKLRNKFLYIQAFLHDAGNQNPEASEKSQLVNLWLNKVMDVAYSAEDFMDELSLETFRRQLELKKNPKFRNIFSLSKNPIVFRFRVSHKVSRILSMFADLDDEAKSIGLKQVDLVRDAAVASANYHRNNSLIRDRQHAAANGSEFVGRKIDEEELIGTLCSPSNDARPISTIAIVGMGGLGKTTLARRLYENEKVDRHFDKKVWICAPENFDVNKLLNEIVESLTSCKFDLSNTEAIIKKLQGDLKGKKFLLVLDDVWNTNIERWVSLKRWLHRIVGLTGSVILITTRNSEVARKAEITYKHSLMELSKEESWALFKQKVGFNDGQSNVSYLEDIGRRIVEKCKGVPLAIKMIGGLLQLKQHTYEWESIEKSEWWDLPPDENMILPSLLLSFNHLPSPYIKQCFAYCAIFPKDCVMQKDDLVSLWLAQGFLCKSETSNLTMEEISDDYLRILLNNGFLQEGVIQSGEVLSYKMHDLVHDLALYVSQNDLSVWGDRENLDNAFHCRHLVFNISRNKTVPKFPREEIMHKIRTIIFLSGVPRDLLTHARYVRTVKIDKIGIKEVPAAICQLKHLRYLDLSNNPIKALPDMITKLYQLQTLRLVGCKQLKQLPRELHKLVNLRHIPTTYPVSVFRGLKQLRCLQTLPHLKLHDREGWTVEELGPLREVSGKLSIFGLEHVKSKEEAKEACLGRKPKISRLELSWHEGRAESSTNITDEYVLDGLEPHPNLKWLSICNYGGVILPSWIMSMGVVTRKHGGNPAPLSNLCVVKLINCRRCRQLPTLGQLPCLKYLDLVGFDVQCISSDFYVCNLGVPPMCQNSSSSSCRSSTVDPLVSTSVFFPALRELQIWDFRSLTTWVPPPAAAPPRVAAFPLLETLLVYNCPQLETTPVLEFPSLRRLEIQDPAGTQPLDIIKYNSHLTSLTVCKLSELNSLPQEVSNCTNLQKLEIQSCKQLMSLPTGLQCLRSLKIFLLRNCPALTWLPDDLFNGLQSLRELSISDCEGLTNLPTSLQECASLEVLVIYNCPLIETSIPDLSLLVSLVRLVIVNSGELMTSLLEVVQHLPHLRDLGIGGFDNEDDLRDYFSDMTSLLDNQSLTTLRLDKCPNIKSLPQQFQLLTALQGLGISEFDDLEQVPEWIGKLPSLEDLVLWRCKNLKYLPSQDAMSCLTQLRVLLIDECPLLAERCAGDNSPEWSKISCVPYIQINKVAVQNLLCIDE